MHSHQEEWYHGEFFVSYEWRVLRGVRGDFHFIAAQEKGREKEREEYEEQ